MEDIKNFGLVLPTEEEKKKMKNVVFFNDENFDETVSKITPVMASKSATGIPLYTSYEYELGQTHNQGSYGTCYAESATSWIEQWLWRKTGNKISFSTEEILDVAADSKGQTYNQRKKSALNSTWGGWPTSVFSSAYNYNSNLSNHYFSSKKTSSNFSLFKNQVDATFGSLTIYTYGGWNVDRIKLLLSRFGPMTYCTYWYGNGSGAHAILACKYDDQNIYIRNSFGSSTLTGRSWSSEAKNSMQDMAFIGSESKSPDTDMN